MDKQREVLKYLHDNGEQSLKEIYDNVPFGYYHNWSKHLGALMSRMIKNGTVERVRNGVFRFKTSVKSKAIALDNPDQTSLL